MAVIKDIEIKMEPRHGTCNGCMERHSGTTRHPKHGTRTWNDAMQIMEDINIWNIILTMGNGASDRQHQELRRRSYMLCQSAMATLFDVNMSDLSTKLYVSLFNFFQFCV